MHEGRKLGRSEASEASASARESEKLELFEDSEKLELNHLHWQQQIVQRERLIEI